MLTKQDTKKRQGRSIETQSQHLVNLRLLDNTKTPPMMRCNILTRWEHIWSIMCSWSPCYRGWAEGHVSMLFDSISLVLPGLEGVHYKERLDRTRLFPE